MTNADDKRLDAFLHTCLRRILKVHLYMRVSNDEIRRRAGISTPGGGGGTPLFGLYGDVPLDRVRFFDLAVLNRVYNLTCLCPKRVKDLS